MRNVFHFNLRRNIKQVFEIGGKSNGIIVVSIRLNQLPNRTEDLAQKMLKMVPGERISAQDALQHPYFSTLPPPIMHLRDSKSNAEVYLPPQS